MLRELQPDIIINDRSRLDEDFGTPEGRIAARDRDWEACMTFNDISWGYLDSSQAAPYSYSAQRIIKMLNTTCLGGGNLLLNIGPAPDGSVPQEAIEPLRTVGRWLAKHGEAVYGKIDRNRFNRGAGASGSSARENIVYLWNYIWPSHGSITHAGFMTEVKKVTLLTDGSDVDFEQNEYRLTMKGLPETGPDETANIAVFKIEFAEKPEFVPNIYYPQLHQGQQF